MIYLPKFKGIYSERNLKSHVSVAGEYKAVLQRSDGTVKYDSGWQKNTILNQGLYNLISNTSTLDYMSLGTSNVATDNAQTGLQGTLLETDTAGNYLFRSSFVSAANSGAPDYITEDIQDYVADPGEATGTIGEFVLHSSSSDAYTQATIRVALTTPIVKGASDVLTIEHKLILYPGDIADTIGVIDIGGDPYNYVFRRLDADRTHSGHAYHLEHMKGSYTYFRGEGWNGTLGLITDKEPNGTRLSYTDRNDNDTKTIYTGGTDPNWYRHQQFIAQVDDMNGLFNIIRFWNTNDRGTWQCSIDKVSGGGGFTKLNTHTFSAAFRTYIQRYVP